MSLFGSVQPASNPLGRGVSTRACFAPNDEMRFSRPAFQTKPAASTQCDSLFWRPPVPSERVVSTTGFSLGPSNATGSLFGSATTFAVPPAPVSLGGESETLAHRFGTADKSFEEYRFGTRQNQPALFGSSTATFDGNFGGSTTAVHTSKSGASFHFDSVSSKSPFGGGSSFGQSSFGAPTMATKPSFGAVTSTATNLFGVGVPPPTTNTSPSWTFGDAAEKRDVPNLFGAPKATEQVGNALPTSKSVFSWPSATTQTSAIQNGFTFGADRLTSQNPFATEAGAKEAPATTEQAAQNVNTPMFGWPAKSVASTVQSGFTFGAGQLTSQNPFSTGADAAATPPVFSFSFGSSEAVTSPSPPAAAESAVVESTEQVVVNSDPYAAGEVAAGLIHQQRPAVDNSTESLSLRVPSGSGGSNGRSRASDFVRRGTGSGFRFSTPSVVTTSPPPAEQKSEPLVIGLDTEEPNEFPLKTSLASTRVGMSPADGINDRTVPEESVVDDCPNLDDYDL